MPIVTVGDLNEKKTKLGRTIHRDNEKVEQEGTKNLHQRPYKTIQENERGTDD